MTWAEMCLFERNTARRGRSAVPRTVLRTRGWRRMRRSRLCLALLLMAIYFPALPAFAAHLLTE